MAKKNWSIEVPIKIPKGQSRFKWLTVFGGDFKRRKMVGETFTNFMIRIGMWKK